jgi:S1-C subfamily serine protease
MKKLILSAATVLGVAIISLPSFADTFVFSGVKKSGDKKLLVTEITHANRDDGIALTMKTPSNTKLSVTYEFGEQKSVLLNKEYTSSAQVRIPDGEKFIYIEKPGIHKFTAVSSKPDGSAASKELLVKVDAGQNISVPSNIDFSKAEKSEPHEIANIEEAFKTLKDVKGRKIGLLKTRSIGSSLYKKIADSVVLITNGDSIGSGSVIDEDGRILTNWHVVDGAKTVGVIFRPPTFSNVSESEEFVADVIRVNEEMDLALIKLRKVSREFTPIKLASAQSIEIAMDVHAVGHPRGNFWSYTKGVLSQVRPNFNWSSSDQLKHKADVLQTQTPINPGNSGGPLMNDNAEIVGVNSFIDAKSQGLNFAVAVTSVEEFLSQRNTHVEAKKNKPVRKGKAVRIDLDKDGYREIWAFDDNNNGKPDRFRVDKDKDGNPDVVLYDRNENGVFELQFSIETFKNKKFGLFKIDKNEDGKIESYGFDFDLDGKIDKVEPV